MGLNFSTVSHVFMSSPDDAQQVEKGLAEMGCNHIQFGILLNSLLMFVESPLTNMSY